MRHTLIVLLMTGLLVSLSAVSADKTLPFPVPLNHFFVVPDAATYKAIAGSEFLRKEFAVTETRTTVRADSTYTGFYLYGANTYFEFLDSINDNSIGKGDSGVAFSIDQAGGLQALAKALPAEFPEEAPTITRGYNDRAVPWFFMARPKSFPYKDKSGFSFWLMEYHPRFLAEWKPQPNSTNQGVTRHDILQRYAATLADKPAQPLLQDVIGLTVALDQARAVKWIELCRTFGYRVRTEKEASVLQGPDFTLRLIPATGAARGIREVKMRLSRKPAKAQEYKLGATALTLHGDSSATWTF
jgi:hypothetical protein